MFKKGHKINLGRKLSAITIKKLSRHNSGGGNPMFGKRHSEQTKIKISNARTSSMSCHLGYTGLHAWVRKHKPIASCCQDCNKSSRLELANISGKYERNVKDYEWLCRKCHMLKDGRLAKLRDSLFQRKASLSSIKNCKRDALGKFCRRFK